MPSNTSCKDSLMGIGSVGPAYIQEYLFCSQSWANQPQHKKSDHISYASIQEEALYQLNFFPAVQTDYKITMAATDRPGFFMGQGALQQHTSQRSTQLTLTERDPGNTKPQGITSLLLFGSCLTGCLIWLFWHMYIYICLWYVYTCIHMQL